jgi:acetolactate synthase-1/2/3 large subunit
MDGAELFVRCLHEEGVRYVFALPGEENLDLIEALRTSSIRLIVARHEQHAAFMAATYGRLTGRAGVCLATLGPGATNLVTGVAHAQLGGMPLVAITGQKAARENRQGAFQLLDAVGVLRPLTKWNTSIAAPSRIPRCVRFAFKTAEAERPGAVHLELPEDVAGEDAGGALPHKRIVTRRSIPDPKGLDDAAEMIRQSRMPLVIVSAGANRNRVARRLKTFAEATGIYVLCTQMGKGVLPEDHPQSLFSLGIHKRDYVHAVIDAADLIVTVGYHIAEFPPSVWNADSSKRILHIDFRPAEPDAFYAPAWEVVGDISAALVGLTERLKGKKSRNRTLAAARAEIARHLFQPPADGAFPPSPRSVVHAVRAVMGPSDVVALDNGIYKVWFARTYRALAPNTLLLDNALATMGAGLAAAMAAKLVLPKRKVLAVCGDGGFLMNVQDLETAVRLKQDLVVLVLRDDAYGFIRWKQHEMGFPDFGMTFGNPDFVRLADAFGAHGMRLEKGDRLEDVLKEAFTRKGTVLIDCPVDYAENALLSRDLSADIRPQLSPKAPAAPARKASPRGKPS